MMWCISHTMHTAVFKHKIQVFMDWRRENSSFYIFLQSQWSDSTLVLARPRKHMGNDLLMWLHSAVFSSHNSVKFFNLLKSLFLQFSIFIKCTSFLHMVQPCWILVQHNMFIWALVKHNISCLSFQDQQR
jgi:hypothetical protein